MKKIVIAVVLFFAVVKVMDIIIFMTLKYFYNHTYVGQDGGDINKYLLDSNHPELVIMGSSTTKFQVNPDSFPVKSCNLARAMTTDCYQLGLLSLMIQHNRAPKNILLSLWPRNYVTANPKEKQPEDILFLRYYYNGSDYVKTEINNISYFEKYKFLLSSYRFNGTVANVLRYYVQTQRSNPSEYFFKYQAPNTNDSINVLAIKKMRKPNKEGKSLTLSNLQPQYLSRFIDTCAKYNINLMCYYMPMLDEDTVLIKKGVDVMDKMIADKNIPLLKFTEQNAPSIFSHTGYWVDGEHMNEKGGAIQSSMLAAFVKEHIK